MDELLMGLLTPEQQQMAQQRAQQAGLLNLGFGLLQASQGQRGQPRPGFGQVIGQAGPGALQAYHGSFDDTLKNLLVAQQLKDAQTKRARETAVQQAMMLPTTREQIDALRSLGAYSDIAGIAAAEKALRQSGVLRTPGEVDVENPFLIYAQSDIPGVSKLAKQYQKSYETGAISDEKATERLGELGRMEESARARQQSAAQTQASRDIAAKERELKRDQGTEAQAKASGFAGTMIQSEETIKQLEKDFGDAVLPTTGTSLAGGIPFIGGYAQRKAMSQEQQVFKNAADAWIRSKLRWESGAAIGEKEMEDEYATYFPLPGDDPETVANKASLRKTATANMIRNAGQLFKGGGGSSLSIEDIRNNYGLEPKR